MSASSIQDDQPPFTQSSTSWVPIDKPYTTDPDIIEQMTDEYVGCLCQGSNSCNDSSSCLCLKLSQGSNFYSGKLVAPPNLHGYQKPVLECHSNCACSNQFCGNQVLGRGPLPCLTIYETVSKGQALKTDRDIIQNTFVCEYIGELIQSQEAKKRLAYCRTPNYLLCVQERFSTNQTNTYIDARHYGNLSRFINHSCEPNLVSVVMRSGCNLPRIGLFAARNIAAEEELTFSYGSSESALSKTRCLCGSSSCTGFLPFDGVSD
ncbi:probable histone-lysine N-methyltransferase set-23 [Watersipora subatra]|uniref:probable histone-lysine N-methyltransferase set-23 n=1 Tax=Watersipora subatra TaxID=2589382 RepID=UPI00355B3B3C